MQLHYLGNALFKSLLDASFILRSFYVGWSEPNNFQPYEPRQLFWLLPFRSCSVLCSFLSHRLKGSPLLISRALFVWSFLFSCPLPSHSSCLDLTGLSSLSPQLSKIAISVLSLHTCPPHYSLVTVLQYVSLAIAGLILFISLLSWITVLARFLSND